MAILAEEEDSFSSTHAWHQGAQQFSPGVRVRVRVMVMVMVRVGVRVRVWVRVRVRVRVRERVRARARVAVRVRFGVMDRVRTLVRAGVRFGVNSCVCGLFLSIHTGASRARDGHFSRGGGLLLFDAHA